MIRPKHAWIATAVTLAIFFLSNLIGRPGFLEALGTLSALATIAAWIVVAVARKKSRDDAEREASRTATPTPSARDASELRNVPATWHRAAPAQGATARPATTRQQLPKRDAGEIPRREGHRPFLLLGSDGYPWMEVEGEFARTDAIEMVIGRKLREDQEVEIENLEAELRPEPTNPHDRNAVMVIIKGRHVGYLGREDAAQYQPHLTRLVAAEVVPLAKARLWAAARRDWANGGTKLNARVTLAVGQPDRLAPLNNPPAAPYSLVPWGSGLQVTGEENHLDALSDFVTPAGDGIAIGTLHALQVPAAKGASREVAELRLDGERVGQMTPSSSAHFLPTIRHLEDQGRRTAVWVRVKGSAVAAQAVLQATKAHELPADWFGSPVTIPELYPRHETRQIDLEDADDAAEISEAARDAREPRAPMWDD